MCQWIDPCEFSKNINKHDKVKYPRPKGDITGEGPYMSQWIICAGTVKWETAESNGNRVNFKILQAEQWVDMDIFIKDKNESPENTESDGWPSLEFYVS